MHQPAVVQAHGPGRQREIHRALFLGIGQHQFLIDAEQVAVRRRRAVGAQPAGMRSGNHAHAAVFGIRIVHRQPCRDRERGFKPPVGRVLMPRHPLAVAAVLAEEMGREEQEIGTQHLLNAIENRRCEGGFHQEFVVEMLVDQADPHGLAPHACLERVDLGAELRQSLRAQNRQPVQVAVCFEESPAQFGCLRCVRGSVAQWGAFGSDDESPQGPPPTASSNPTGLPSQSRHSYQWETSALALGT